MSDAITDDLKNMPDRLRAAARTCRNRRCEAAAGGGRMSASFACKQCDIHRWSWANKNQSAECWWQRHGTARSLACVRPVVCLQSSTSDGSNRGRFLTCFLIVYAVGPEIMRKTTLDKTRRSSNWKLERIETPIWLQCPTSKFDSRQYVKPLMWQMTCVNGRGRAQVNEGVNGRGFIAIRTRGRISYDPHVAHQDTIRCN